jgi:AcrR family transcriptional regulator
VRTGEKPLPRVVAGTRQGVCRCKIDFTFRSDIFCSVSDKDPVASRRGRPPSVAAENHAAILDAVYALLQQKSVRDLTMEAVAKRAGVGKPTLYKWWPSKAALVLAMFRERIVDARPEPVRAGTAEETIRRGAVAIIRALHGLLGKVLAELIAEGQSEPAIVRQLFDEHLRGRRAADAAEIERGKANGELRGDTDPELVLDAVFGAIYYRLLLRSAPLTEQYGTDLVTQVFNGVKVRPSQPSRRVADRRFGRPDRRRRMVTSGKPPGKRGRRPSLS